MKKIINLSDGIVTRDSMKIDSHKTGFDTEILITATPDLPNTVESA